MPHKLKGFANSNKTDLNSSQRISLCNLIGTLDTKEKLLECKI